MVRRVLIALMLAPFALLAATLPAVAGCSSPAGNAGDIIFSSVSQIMTYCNGTSWISMGTSSTTSFGTLTTNDFCIATSPTSIACNTGATGTGNVVLSASPTLTGTITAAGATFSSSVGIGTTSPGALFTVGNNAFEVNSSGTVLAGLWNGGAIGVGYGGTGITTGTSGGVLYFNSSSSIASSAALTANLPVIGGGAGAPPSVGTVTGNTTKFATSTGSLTANDCVKIDASGNLVDAGAACAAAMIFPGAGIANSTGSAWGTSYSVTGTGNVVLSASPTLTGTITGAAANFSGNVGIGTAPPQAKLSIQAGEVQVGSSGASCANNIQGAIRYSAGVLYYCDNATTWESLDSSGTGGSSDWIEVTATAPNPSGTTQGYFGASATLGAILSGQGSTADVTIENKAGTPAFEVLDNSTNISMPGSVGIGTATATNTLTVNGGVAYQLGSDYTTTGSQADVSLGAAATVRYNGSGAATFYGIVAGQNGQLLELHNASSSTLTLSNQSGSESTAANRIITGSGSDLQMASNSSVSLQYDTSASRWRIIGGSGGGVPTGTTGQVQYNSGSNSFAANQNFTFLSTNAQLVVGTGAATPIGLGTTGNVSSVIMNVMPQAVAVTPSGVSGVVTVNGGATGQMAYYSNSNTISGTTDLYVSGSNIAIGTSNATYLLSLDGQSARTIGMQRDYTASTVGQMLTLQAGGAASGGSNLNGGNLVLSSGTSTGSGTSQIQFQTFPGTAGSSSDNTVATAMTILGNGNVGIGTTSPVTSLQVNGTVTDTGETVNGTMTATAVSAGTSTFTGVVTGVTPTSSTHLATKAYVDTAVAGAGGSGAPVDFQVFTSTGTWTKPGSGTMAYIQCWGGGGGGANAPGYTFYACSGGGGGGYAYIWKALSGLTSTVTVTIGAGGSAGSNGSNTTFGSYLTANGGSGAPTFGPGAGGTGSGSVVAIVQGQPGNMPTYDNNVGYSMGGNGGAATNGGGGGASNYSGTAGAGGVPGGGGGGGASWNNGTQYNGGAGGAGECVVTTY